MKLITEQIEEICTITEDAADGKKQHFIEGIFLQGNVKNRNGRFYPTSTLAEAVKKFDQAFIQTKRAMGELNHPEGPSVNPERASHLITELKQVGDNFHGRARILENLPCGKIVKGLLEEGVQLGVSSRGLGSIRELNGSIVVQPDFHLSTVDIVADPSAHDAFVQGIMEGREWIWDNGEFVEQQLESFKALSSSQLEAKKSAFFHDFLHSLQ